MQDSVGRAAMAAVLASVSEDFTALMRRVEREGDARPTISATGWSGPASWACELSLALLGREIESAIEQLRSAAGLTDVAAREVEHGA